MDEEFTEAQDAWFKEQSGLIVKLVEENMSFFTPQEDDALSLCNASMQYCINTGNMNRALWEVRNTLKILKNILEF